METTIGAGGVLAINKLKPPYKYILKYTSTLTSVYSSHHSLLPSVFYPVSVTHFVNLLTPISLLILQSLPCLPSSCPLLLCPLKEAVMNDHDMRVKRYIYSSQKGALFVLVGQFYK